MTAVTNMLLHDAIKDSYYKHAANLHGRRVWLACSGGRDSLSLALVCQQLFKVNQLAFLPQLLHVNHGMQLANDEWALQVSAWAKHHQMPCHILNIQLDRKSEQAARQARYHAMMQMVNDQDVLLLGHHQDDQAETVLMRLFNGAGVNGLGGMQEWSTKLKDKVSDSNHTVPILGAQQFNNSYIYLWRPWLQISRAQITDFAISQRLNFIDDPTNVIAKLNQGSDNSADADVDNTVDRKNQTDANNSQGINDRAWLRSVLIPTITQRYPKAKQAVVRTALLMQNAQDIINEQIVIDKQNVVVTDTAWQSIIDIESLGRLSEARQSSLIHSWLSPKPNAVSPTKRLIDDVLGLCRRSDNDHQTMLSWQSGGLHYVVCRYKKCLYRLQKNWLDWLKIKPDTTDIVLTAKTVYKLEDMLVLKSSNASFIWRIRGLSHLTAAILTAYKEFIVSPNIAGSHIIDVESSMKFKFMPLPRRLKLQLIGREGRKANKKLLQALNQPSFARTSIALCSLSIINAYSKQSLKFELPLFIVTTDGLHVVSSPFAHLISKLISSHNLQVQVVYNKVQ